MTIDSKLSEKMTGDQYQKALFSFVARCGEKLGSEAWLKEYEFAIKAVFPMEWTHIALVNLKKIGKQLIHMGVLIQSVEDLFFALSIFETVGILRCDGQLLKRNPASVYQTIH